MMEEMLSHIRNGSGRSVGLCVCAKHYVHVCAAYTVGVARIVPCVRDYACIRGTGGTVSVCYVCM